MIIFTYLHLKIIKTENEYYGLTNLVKLRVFKIMSGGAQ